MKKTRSDIQKQVSNYIFLTEKNEDIKNTRIYLLQNLGYEKYLEYVDNVDFVPCGENKLKYKAVSKPNVSPFVEDFVNNQLIMLEKRNG